MSIAFDKDIEVEAFVVLLDDPIAVVSGVLLWVGAERYRLRLDSPHLAAGMRLLVTVDTDRLPGRIEAIEGSVVTVARTEVHGTDDRACPRVGAQFPLVWSVVGAASGARAAMSEGVSVSGVNFDVAVDPPAVGARLHIEATLTPGAVASPIEAIVRRAQPTATGWSVGVEFVDMDEATFDALTDLTLQYL